MAHIPLANQRALRQAVMDICSDILLATTEQAGAEDVSKALIHLVHSAVLESCRLRNDSMAVTSRLPPELLIAVFTLLPLSGRIVTSHVCHTWRRVSLEQPALLWSDISGCHEPWMLDLALQHSKDIPASIRNLHIGGANVGPTVGFILQRHMRRIRVLHLVLDAFVMNDDPEADLYVSHMLSQALEEPAPCLEAFSAVDTDGGGWLDFRCINLFRGGAPRLHSLSILGLGESYGLPDLSTPVFNKLRRLQLGGAEDITMSSTQIASALQYLPLLQFLGVEFSNYRDLPTTHPPGIVFPPKELTHIVISSCGDAPTSLIRMFCPDGLPRVDVLFRLGQPSLECISSALYVLSHEASQMDIVYREDQFTHSGLFVRTVAVDGTSRSYRHLVMRLLPAIVGHSFRPIECLRINAALLNRISETLSFPSVETLTVVLDEPLAPSAHAILCEDLRRVHIIATPKVIADGSPSAHVHALVERNIRYSDKLAAMQLNWEWGSDIDIKELAEQVVIDLAEDPYLEWVDVNPLQWE
ncbi:hypothetical protein EXIGLDRAFT_747709 [Exidia glandulosa HHB12029]|uniref:F-box domain-containing protein n=1 Tax=Exidia glandulosa HHB12029 TaxID=1314781 RepID=A0A165KHZ1_EXIGL|nr:hypothetical protein EXIGLDRAFT_747709 [Exidia glandulosa HHB12029]